MFFEGFARNCLLHRMYLATTATLTSISTVGKWLVQIRRSLIIPFRIEMEAGGLKRTSTQEEDSINVNLWDWDTFAIVFVIESWNWINRNAYDHADKDLLISSFLLLYFSPYLSCDICKPWSPPSWPSLRVASLFAWGASSDMLALDCLRVTPRIVSMAIQLMQVWQNLRSFWL